MHCQQVLASNHFVKPHLMFQAPLYTLTHLIHLKYIIVSHIHHIETLFLKSSKLVVNSKSIHSQAHYFQYFPQKVHLLPWHTKSIFIMSDSLLISVYYFLIISSPTLWHYFYPLFDQIYLYGIMTIRLIYVMYLDKVVSMLFFSKNNVL